MAHDLSMVFPEEKFNDAKRLLTTVKPWWSRYLSRFEAVPIAVPRHDEEEQWRARVSIAEKSLTMYVDVNFALEATLAQLAGAIEHELQRSRRRFDERERAVPEVARGEYWRIATRMEVAGALTSEYEHSQLRHDDLLHRLLSTSATFGPSLVEKYNVDELPVSDMTWMPEMLDLERHQTAEDYAIEMARRDGKFDEPDEGDSPEPDEEDEEEGGAPGSGGGGDSEEESAGEDDQSEDESESHQEGASDSDSSDSDEEDESESDSEDTDAHSDDSGDSGADEDEDGQSADSDEDSDESGEGSGAGSSDDADAEDDPADDGGYQQLNTDTDEGEGRSGGGYGEGASGEPRDSTDSDTLDGADAAQSTGIEESNQIASSDGRTDRASSGTQGNISQSENPTPMADQIEQMKQEDAVLEWDANKSRPEVFDPFYSESADEIEAAELQLERSEREEADDELVEDIKSASLAREFDPAAPLAPSFDDQDVADEYLRRRGVHWTDYFSDILSHSVSNAVLKGSDDFSYAQRNPNQTLTGPILMGGISYSPTIYTVFDTSGSMMAYLQAEKEFLAELFESVSQNYHAHVTWFAASANIYHAGEATDFDMDVVQAFGRSGGSTNFCEDINALLAGDFEFGDEHYDEPDVLVLMSDMEFPWSGAVAHDEPDIPVIRVVPARSLVKKAVQRNKKMLGVPSWIYDQENLIEMI